MGEVNKRLAALCEKNNVFIRPFNVNQSTTVKQKQTALNKRGSSILFKDFDKHLTATFK